MSIINLDTATLRSLIKLTDRKDSFLAKIAKIESDLAALISGKPVRKSGAGVRKSKAGIRKSKVGKQPGRPSKKASLIKVKSAATSVKLPARVGLKEKILTALRAAGDEGLKVPELSKKIGAKSSNVHVWFSSTGKKLPEIKKIGKGHFRYLEKK
jgi:hypothetical protein